MEDKLTLNPVNPVEPMETEIDGIPVIITPPNWNVNKMGDCLEAPTRVKQDMSFTAMASFVAYVNKFKTSASIIRLFKGAKGQISAEAIIDYHEDNTDGAAFADWCNHIARFETRQTDSWEEWLSFNGKMQTQAEFADFIYQNMKDIVEPDGASLLEIIQTLRAHSKGEFKDMKHQNGSYEVVNRMKVSTTSGTTDAPLTLPESFTIAVLPFYKAPPVTLKADIYLKVPRSDGEPLRLGYKIYRLTDAIQEMEESVEEQVAKLTDLPVYHCSK